MITRLRRLVFWGALLAGVGSFLPWQQGGDFLPYWNFGIQLFPAIKDNGGSITLALSLAICYLTIKPHKYLLGREKICVALSALLMAVSIVFVIVWLDEYLKTQGMMGAPMIQLGLLMVLFGSIQSFVASLLFVKNNKGGGLS